MYKRNEQKKKKEKNIKKTFSGLNEITRQENEKESVVHEHNCEDLYRGRLKDRQKSKSRCSKREKLSSIYKRSTAASDAGLTVRAPGEYVLKYSLKDLCAFFFFNKEKYVVWILLFVDFVGICFEVEKEVRAGCVVQRDIWVRYVC